MRNLYAECMDAKTMKDSLVVLAFFAMGIALGVGGCLPAEAVPADLTEWLLYVLVVQIGISLGAGGSLWRIVASFNLRSLVLPFATIVGTLVFTALAGLVLGGWSLAEYMAVGSGMGYYSLSSVMIIDIKSGSIGVQAATQLGVLAVMVNIVREMTSLVCGPWLARVFGCYAPISAAGVTSMDVTLPMIVHSSGQEMFPTALMHGLVLEISVPLLVTLFASM